MSCAIPIPVSWTERAITVSARLSTSCSRLHPSRATVTSRITLPRSVNWKVFESRFLSHCHVARLHPVEVASRVHAAVLLTPSIRRGRLVGEKRARRGHGGAEGRSRCAVSDHVGLRRLRPDKGSLPRRGDDAVAPRLGLALANARVHHAPWRAERWQPPRHAGEARGPLRDRRGRGLRPLPAAARPFRPWAVMQSLRRGAVVWPFRQRAVVQSLRWRAVMRPFRQRAWGAVRAAVLRRQRAGGGAALRVRRGDPVAKVLHMLRESLRLLREPREIIDLAGALRHTRVLCCVSRRIADSPRRRGARHVPHAQVRGKDNPRGAARMLRCTTTRQGRLHPGGLGARFGGNGQKCAGRPPGGEVWRRAI